MENTVSLPSQKITYGNNEQAKHAKGTTLRKKIKGLTKNTQHKLKTLCCLLNENKSHQFNNQNKKTIDTNFKQQSLIESDPNKRYKSDISLDISRKNNNPSCQKPINISEKDVEDKITPETNRVIVAGDHRSITENDVKSHDLQENCASSPQELNESVSRVSDNVCFFPKRNEKLQNDATSDYSKELTESLRTPLDEDKKNSPSECQNINSNVSEKSNEKKTLIETIMSDTLDEEYSDTISQAVADTLETELHIRNHPRGEGEKKTLTFTPKNKNKYKNPIYIIYKDKSHYDSIVFVTQHVPANVNSKNASTYNKHLKDKYLPVRINTLYPDNEIQVETSSENSFYRAVLISKLKAYEDKYEPNQIIEIKNKIKQHIEENPDRYAKHTEKNIANNVTSHTLQENHASKLRESIDSESQAWENVLLPAKSEQLPNNSAQKKNQTHAEAHQIDVLIEPEDNSTHMNKTSEIDDQPGNKKHVASHNSQENQTQNLQKISDNAVKASENSALPDKDETLQKHYVSQEKLHESILERSQNWNEFNIKIKTPDTEIEVEVTCHHSQENQGSSPQEFVTSQTLQANHASSLRKSNDSESQDSESAFLSEKNEKLPELDDRELNNSDLENNYPVATRRTFSEQDRHWVNWYYSYFSQKKDYKNSPLVKSHQEVYELFERIKYRPNNPGYLLHNLENFRRLQDAAERSGKTFDASLFPLMYKESWLLDAHPLDKIYLERRDNKVSRNREECLKIEERDFISELCEKIFAAQGNAELGGA